MFDSPDVGKSSTTTTASEQEDLAIQVHEMMREVYEQTCKVFFILRDQYLLTKVQVTGVIVFHVKKETKHMIGLDDGSGILTCVIWLNDFGARHNNDRNIRTWLYENDVKKGDTLSILGGLEYFRDKIQLNCHRLRVVNEASEEMLLYQ